MEESSYARGRLDARGGPGQLLFGRMYEDAAIERRWFPSGGRIFCIASAGCTAFDLARDHDVVAVDINPVQIAYARQRLAGAAPRPGRIDRGMSFLRAAAPLVGWTPRVVRAFLDLADPADQLSFWRKHLDTARFRAALDGLLSPSILRLVYARPMIQSLPARFGRVLRARLERGFARHPNRSNLHARALFLNGWDGMDVSPDARSIVFVHADAAEFLEREPPESYHGFTLSNILDGAGETYAARLWQAVRRAAKPGAVALLRSFAEPADSVAAERAAEDRAMIWGTVEVRRS